MKDIEVRDVFELLENMWPAKTFQEKLKMKMLELEERAPLCPERGIVLLDEECLMSFISNVELELAPKSNDMLGLKAVVADLNHELELLPHQEISGNVYLSFDSRFEMAETWLPIIRRLRRLLLKYVSGCEERQLVIEMLSVYEMTLEDAMTEE